MKVFSAKKKGFTLIELLVVVMILGILSSIALPQYRRSVERARVAEALTLMRAVYDSRERVAWERQYDSYASIPASSRFGFNKLDITAKGTYSGTNSTVLTTENFVYNMMPTNVATITATARKGSYKGAVITFNGSQFTCSTKGLSGEAAKACTVWGSSTWNQ